MEEVAILRQRIRRFEMLVVVFQYESGMKRCPINRNALNDRNPSQ